MSKHIVHVPSEHFLAQTLHVIAEKKLNKILSHALKNGLLPQAQKISASIALKDTDDELVYVPVSPVFYDKKGDRAYGYYGGGAQKTFIVPKHFDKVTEYSYGFYGFSGSETVPLQTLPELFEKNIDIITEKLIKVLDFTKQYIQINPITVEDINEIEETIKKYEENGIQSFCVCTMTKDKKILEKLKSNGLIGSSYLYLLISEDENENFTLSEIKIKENEYGKNVETTLSFDSIMERLESNPNDTKINTYKSNVDFSVLRQALHIMRQIILGNEPESFPKEEVFEWMNIFSGWVQNKNTNRIYANFYLDEDVIRFIKESKNKGTRLNDFANTFNQSLQKGLKAIKEAEPVTSNIFSIQTYGVIDLEGRSDTLKKPSPKLLWDVSCERTWKKPKIAFRTYNAENTKKIVTAMKADNPNYSTEFDIILKNIDKEHEEFFAFKNNVSITTEKYVINNISLTRTVGDYFAEMKVGGELLKNLENLDNRHDAKQNKLLFFLEGIGETLVKLGEDIKKNQRNFWQKKKEMEANFFNKKNKAMHANSQELILDIFSQVKKINDTTGFSKQKDLLKANDLLTVSEQIGAFTFKWDLENNVLELTKTIDSYKNRNRLSFDLNKSTDTIKKEFESSEKNEPFKTVFLYSYTSKQFLKKCKETTEKLKYIEQSIISSSDKIAEKYAEELLLVSAATSGPNSPNI